jgi:hypothetical protein
LCIHFGRQRRNDYYCFKADATKLWRLNIAFCAMFSRFLKFTFWLEHH